MRGEYRRWRNWEENAEIYALTINDRNAESIVCGYSDEIEI